MTINNQSGGEVKRAAGMTNGHAFRNGGATDADQPRRMDGCGAGSRPEAEGSAGHSRQISPLPPVGRNDNQAVVRMTINGQSN